MSIPTIQPRALFGLRTDIPNNVYYVTDNEIVYPTAAVLVIHNHSTKRQRYIKLLEKSVKMEGLAVSPKRTMCAILENIEHPQVTIYDLQTLKRKRTLTLPSEASAKRIESIDFSHDEKMIMVLTGDPDWMMYAYNWERGKVETSTRANYLTNPGPVSKVLCSPADNANVLLYGNGIFRMMNMQETVWRQYGFQKADHLNITSCGFLGGDRILIGTHDGLLLIIEIGELKFTYEASCVRQINPKAEKDDEDAIAVGSATLLTRAPVRQSDAYRDRGVRGILPFTKGFAYSCGSGTVYFFERVSTHKYIRRNIYKIDDSDIKEVQKDDFSIVRHLAINPSETYLLATTFRSLIYHVKLWGPDYDIAGDVLFQLLGEPYHTGPVMGLALCLWKPTFITCGNFDRTVRVWNYETETMEMLKQFQEDVYSVSLHPTGLFAAVGFSDKLRIMTVTIEDLQTIREFPIRDCYLSSFSSGGQSIAAVNKFIIQVYSFITFQILGNLRGHNAKITALVWSGDDKKLVSCGMEGAVYEWDMIVGKRTGEVVTKGVSHSSCCLTADGKLIYVVGSDGCIREIANSNILRILDMNVKDLTSITLSRSELMMFIASKRGTILSVKMPLVEPVEYTAFQYHNSAITFLKLSLDDETLISSSSGGVIGIWRLSSIEGKTIVLDKDFTYFNEILISQNDLEEKLATIKDLTQRMQELEMEHAYQMRHIETMFKEKVKELHETYSQAIDEMKESLEMLEVNHNTELNNISSDMNVMKERHEASMLETEAKYNAQLIVEYDKFLMLGETKERMITDYEVKLSELAESKATTIEELTRVNESKMFNFNKMLEESLGEIDKETRDHEEITRQIEDDIDREILTLRKKYEDRLKYEKESNIRLRGEAGVMKKKYLTAQKEISTIHMEIIYLEAEQEKFKAVIRNLEKEILDLKKEISERDLTVQDKERRIYDLKRKDQELERFKFVLNYKIKELKNQIEPRDKEIREKKGQIRNMELELENLLKINNSLDTGLSSLREKLNNVYKSAHTYNIKYRNVMKVIKHVKIDIYNASGYIQDFKLLKDGIKKMYYKYITEKEFITARKGEEECQAEFSRQREYLEHVVSMLRRTVEKDREVHYGDNMHFMETNWKIMDEIYRIRKEVKGAKRKVQDMEALLCFRTAKLYSPRKAIKMVQEALKNPDQIKSEAEEKMEDAKRKTNIVREEAARLSTMYEEMKKGRPVEKLQKGHKEFITFSVAD